MKTITKITFALFAIMLVFTSCSKDNDNAAPKVAKEITVDELLTYQIVEEISVKPEYIPELGNQIYFRVYVLERNINNTERFFMRSYTASTQSVAESAITYNAETGITTLKTNFGYVELTRDKNNQIELKGGHYFNENNKKIQTKYMQLVKLTNDVFVHQTYKAVSGNGYYRFSNLKWRYKQDSAPADGELTWNYERYKSTLWAGYDGGTAKYLNLFVVIPKGNGWKGSHLDKNLLLVYVYDQNKQIQIGDITICALDN
ncbi:hypothetical protein [Sphingobacterium faecale]|uniref:DUF4595 domain-containing protein n=1 Tax=Sphingobacterium faecale TaxID=2803775 RepID=A0ABS1R6U4_9SPHI|nr:hypothetical protein [Sphingobacterium faecale]MBL1410435.1 hypothetical protein [Sphingobacterium faecale]